VIRPRLSDEEVALLTDALVECIGATKPGTEVPAQVARLELLEKISGIPVAAMVTASLTPQTERPPRRAADSEPNNP
jgi:hypothetical protein